MHIRYIVIMLSNHTVIICMINPSHALCMYNHVLYHNNSHALLYTNTIVQVLYN